MSRRSPSSVLRGLSTERLRTMSCWRSNAFSATNSAVDLVMSPAAAAASVIAADVGFVTFLTASPATRIQRTTFFLLHGGDDAGEHGV